MTLKFDGWPRKTIQHLYTTLSFLHHFLAIGEFKLELQSRNAKFGSNTMIIQPYDLEIWLMTLKTIGHLFYATSSFVHHLVPIGEFKLELQFWKTQFGSKSTFFFSRVTFKFDRWPWKTIGHLFYDTISFVHHFNAIGKFKLKLKSGNAQFRSRSMSFLAVWPRNFTDDLEKQ